MSGPDDTNDTERPPPPDSGTLPYPPTPLAPPSRPALVIRKGEAQIALSAALDDLSRAFVLVEATGMALARQLDESAEEGR